MKYSAGGARKDPITRKSFLAPPALFFI